MFNRSPSPALIYDVSDPMHPRLVCTVSNTTAHLFTADTFVYLRNVSPAETDVVLHSIGSGNESVAVRLPVGTVWGSWRADGSVMAYTVQLPESTDGFASTQVWLYAQNRLALLYTYQDGIGDCICRFGLAPQQLAISPDGQYLIAGWIAGKGSEPLAVYRISDRQRVLTAGPSVYQALWAPTGHRLFLDGTDYVTVWTPEGGAVPNEMLRWPVFPGFSPDGSSVAYTGYAGQTDNPLVAVDDLQAGSGGILTGALRSQVVFVRDGWVWYLEEVACLPSDSCAGSTRPSGRYFAMNLTTRVEQSLAFAAGDDPITMSGDLGSYAFRTPEFWPNSSNA